MLNICVLASGSSGNSTLIWTDTTGILIDCGRSRRYIEEAFASLQFDLSLLKGIVVTHGHGDHVGPAMLSLAKACNAPIYIHRETYDVVRHRADCGRITKLHPELVCHHTERPFTVGDLTITPFPIYHDGGFAGKPYGFSITYRAPHDGLLPRPVIVERSGKKGTKETSFHQPLFDFGTGLLKEYKVGFLTDTGKIDDAIVAALLDCNALVLEANHDPELVAKSDRHPMNKRWVLGDSGHLSNQTHAETVIKIRKLSKSGETLSHVFLAHISEQHNTPLHAFDQVKARLDASRLGSGIELLPTYHRKCSKVLRIA